MANTGHLLQKQRDLNPQSPTYNQTRIVDLGLNLGACPLPATYRSAVVQGSVTKNNCPAGQYGSVLIYTIGAGQFTSERSQADADQQAQAAFDAGKQAYANQNGTCSYTPPGGDTYAPDYLANGCFACTMTNTAYPYDTRLATPDEQTQYHLNRAKADPTEISGTGPLCGDCV